MARPFAALERFFERLFERPAARLFQTRLQPVQLQGRLERAMESERRLSGDRTYVPSRYRILVNPSDIVAFDGFRATVERDLAESLHARARQRGYTLLERPTVSIAASAEVPRGDVVVRPDTGAPLQPPGAPGRGAAAQQPPPPPPPPGFASSGSYPGSGGAAPGAGAFGQDPDLAAAARTAVFQVPAARTPSVVIDVRMPGGPVSRLTVRGGTIRIGRAEDNELVLEDDRVSRHHGQLATRQGRLVYSDLGSTNGSYANGSRVSEIALGPGDVLHLGGSTLTVQAGL
ncbi:MAG: DUF3662 domain-containing protein [Chloroflexi bacterium]|nr:DUF3662 domain-containing protein [Chloroflexota bacterium]